jgi:SAM-dependent methyltransferase
METNTSTLSNSLRLQSIKDLQERFARGENISSYLRSKYGANSPEVIELAYDLQTGTYTEMMKGPHQQLRQNIAQELTQRIKALLPKPLSILEAGIGEGNMLGAMMPLLGDIPSWGFDVSWSRVAQARKWLKEKSVSNTTLFTGDLTRIPCASNSFDIVYTCHAVEPNGGKEREILQELLRVTKKYLLLLEPSYELADEEQRKRMDSHGYVKGLPAVAESLGGNVLEASAFPYRFNPQNPNALIVIEKIKEDDESSHFLADPLFKTPLMKYKTALFSPDSLRAYPILDGIPCLRLENSIVASKFATLNKEVE